MGLKVLSGGGGTVFEVREKKVRDLLPSSPSPMFFSHDLIDSFSFFSPYPTNMKHVAMRKPLHVL